VNGLKGKAAIVVGGAGGLGRAVSFRLGNEGALVIVSDIDEQGATEVAEKIRAEGGNAEAKSVDLRDEESISELVSFTRHRFGHVDLLNNVAADLTHAMDNDQDLLSTAIDAFDETIAVTLRGYVLACRAAIPHMIEAGGGAIVNTSSLAALRALPWGRRYSYAIAKSGLGPLSQHVSTRFGPEGIRCNTVALGLVLSDNYLRLHPEFTADMIAEAKRTGVGDPDAIAAAIAFLLSDDSRVINGQTINLDSGSSAHL
jgi:NAD(P)-dependent dehydrogenase (short-subunit alcohol dehydrogenase family)